MKQNFYNLCLPAVVLLTLLSIAICGCEEAGIPLTEAGETQSPDDVCVPLGVSSVTSEDAATTRAAMTRAAMTRAATNDLNTTTRIGFYVKIPVVTPGSSTPTYVEKGNKPGGYVSGSGKNWWAPDEKIWISNLNSVMTVYAPFDATQPENKISLVAALPKADGSNDILAGTMNVNSLTVSQTGGISVTLSHLYTCLQFTFTKNVNFETAADSKKYTVKINKLELIGADIYAKADYNPYTKAYSSSTTRTDVSLAISPEQTILTGTTGTAVIKTLLIPMHQAFTADATLKITVNSTQGTQTVSKTLSVKIPKGTFTASQPFAPGKQYNFNVKVSPKEEMEITGVSVADWDVALRKSDEMLVD